MTTMKSKTVLLSLVLALAMPTFAFAKEGRVKQKSKSSVVTVVTPAPKPVAPAPVAPAPKPAINPYTQSQIDKALARPQLHPLANCTYCAAHAASIGDFATVEAIGNTYTPPAAPAAPATPAEPVVTP